MTNWFNNLRQRLQSIAQDPAAEMSRGGQTVAYLFELCRHGLRELKHDKAGQMAAALTYHTLFSILPTLVVMLSILAITTNDADRTKIKENITNYLLAPLDTEPPTGTPQQFTVVGESVVPGREETDNPDTITSEQNIQEFNEARLAIKGQIQTLFTQLEGVSFRGIGAIGLLIFIYGATGLLASIEKSFNLIFGVNKSRPWFLRLPLYWTVITLGPLVLLAGQYAQANFLSFIQDTPGINIVGGIASYISPIVTTWLVLTLMYTLLPHTRVRIRAAMIGGLVAAVLWVLAIEGLAFFVRYASTSASAIIYGSLFLLLLFLLWIWITWLIILFGLEVTHAVQAMKSRQFKHMDYATDNDLLVEPAWLLPVIAVVARRFALGKTVSAQRIATKTSLPQRSVDTMLDKLTDANLVRHVDDSDAPGYILARPATRHHRR